MTILVWGIAWMAVRYGRQTIWAHLAFGSMAVTVANAFVPHLAVTVASRRYMPGLATGMFLNVPVLSILLWPSLKMGYVSGWWVVADCIAVAALLVLLIPILLRMGKCLTARQ